MKNKTVFLVGLISLSFMGIAQKNKIDNSVVSEFNIDKYLGTWYEIARYDHSFEKGLEGVTANYSYREDGKIKVVNSGYKDSLTGKKSVSIGKAKIPNPSEPAKLKVSFFLFFYGDYFVMELDPTYKWAVVGSKTDKYLWILSRTPNLNDYILQDIQSRLTKRGYDVNQLIFVEQKPMDN